MKVVSMLAAFVLFLGISKMGSQLSVAGAPSNSQSSGSYPAICDTADIQTITGKGGLLRPSSHGVTTLIQQRIGACKSAIERFIASLPKPPLAIAQNPPGLPKLPSPDPNPTPPSDCLAGSPGDTDVLRLYSTLTYCMKWINGKITPAQSSTPSPRPIAFHTPFPKSPDPWIKPVYVLALASDAPTSAQISLQLANNLRAPQMHPDVPLGQLAQPSKDIYSDRPVRYVVLAAPNWTLAQYQQQCFNDPSTSGAIVAVQPGTQSNAFNLIFSTSWTNTNLQLMVLNCEPTNTAYVNNAAYITWLSHVRNGRGAKSSISLAALLGVLSAILILHPSQSDTFTIAPPKKPIPPSTTYESQYTTTTNQGLGTAAAAGVAALTPLGSSNLGETPSIDSQTAGAVANVLPQLIDDLMWTCTRSKPGYTSFPQPQCEWFTYRPSEPPKP